ncbi:MAG: hypothetical protein CL946_13655 [Ectothiorhodospiraceae bacterium]|nr:hypothetical protein [Ectothiorhodospiraceae bacterium]
MRRLTLLFSSVFILTLLLSPTVPAQLLGDADNLVLRLRSVCNGGQGGQLVVAFDIHARTPNGQARFGGYNVVIAYDPSKLILQGIQQRYATQYWPGGPLFRNKVSGQGIGTWFNQHSNNFNAGSALPMTDQYFSVTSDCGGTPLNDGYFELLRYTFNIQPSASGATSIVFFSVDGYRQAGTFQSNYEATATYYSDLSNNSNDSAQNLIGLVVPVELATFEATGMPDRTVEMFWATETETNNYGFEVQRDIGNGFEQIGFVQGQGTTTSRNEYQYQDAGLRTKNVQDGVARYRLKQIDHDGTVSYSQIAAVSLSPLGVSLDAIYPQPAVSGANTTIPYQMAVAGTVNIGVYNTLGERVATLVEGQHRSEGHHNVNWNGAGDNGTALTDGVYFVRFSADLVSGETVSQTRQITFIR